MPSDTHAQTHRPCGLMDKALVFGSKDCRFETCHGQFWNQKRATKLDTDMQATKPDTDKRRYMRGKNHTQKQNHTTATHRHAPVNIVKNTIFTLLDLCKSSLRRAHANLLCIVPMLSDDPRSDAIQHHIQLHRAQNHKIV